MWLLQVILTIPIGIIEIIVGFLSKIKEKVIITIKKLYEIHRQNPHNPRYPSSV